VVAAAAAALVIAVVVIVMMMFIMIMTTMMMMMMMMQMHKYLSVDIQQMWNTKCLVMLVITGVTGIVTKGLKKI
jgi:hypothetical protein